MIPIIQYTANFSDFLKLNDKTIRRKIEDGLTTFNFSYLAMPPEIETNVPQMMGRSQEGHTQLQVSVRFLQMKVEFDNNYWNDREQCFKYAFEKIEEIERLLRSETAIKFSGVLVSYIQETNTDPIATINRNSVKIPSDYTFFGFSKTFSYVYDDRFFVNFNLSAPVSSGNKQQVSVTVDINNRYGSDIKKVASEENDIRVIKTLHETLTENVIDNLIQKGELTLS